ncbi:MAG TPA: hypothetical protein VMV49_00840, partial [Candidatus Deferrimicrobium sp.]|nr:hypothetical protein [Candidatus Deferrimicrobium sp.]
MTNKKSFLKKSKKILLLWLVVNTLLFYGMVFSNASSATSDIQWQIEEGDTFVWKVTKSTPGHGFLAVNSQYELTITNMTTWAGRGTNSTEIKANFSVYDSTTKITAPLLVDQMFLRVDLDTEDVELYALFREHGFFMTIDYSLAFYYGISSFWGSYFNLKGKSGSTLYGYKTVID